MVGEEPGGEELGRSLGSTEDQSRAFPLMQVGIRPCHLALSYCQRTAEPCLNMDLTGMLLLGLNHKTLFLAGMTANPHCTKQTFFFLRKTHSTFHTLSLTFKTDTS